MGKKLVRLTESELHGIIHKTAERILREGNEIRLAQKELYHMGSNISSICMRLEGTKYEDLAQRMKEIAISLNNALIKDIRGESE